MTASRPGTYTLARSLGYLVAYLNPSATRETRRTGAELGQGSGKAPTPLARRRRLDVWTATTPKSPGQLKPSMQRIDAVKTYDGMVTTEVRKAGSVCEEHRILNEGTFTAFFEETYPSIVRALFLFTADRAESEDLAQEAMARAYERWDDVVRMTSPTGYVYRTAVNVHRRRARRRAAFRRLSQILAREESDSLSHVVERADVGRALTRLPERLREALILVDLLDLNGTEAAEILGIAPASVRSRVSRGRATLRALLEETE